MDHSFRGAAQHIRNNPVEFTPGIIGDVVWGSPRAAILNRRHDGSDADVGAVAKNVLVGLLQGMTASRIRASFVITPCPGS